MRDRWLRGPIAQSMRRVPNVVLMSIHGYGQSIDGSVLLPGGEGATSADYVDRILVDRLILNVYGTFGRSRGGARYDEEAQYAAAMTEIYMAARKHKGWRTSTDPRFERVKAMHPESGSTYRLHLETSDECHVFTLPSFGFPCVGTPGFRVTFSAGQCRTLDLPRLEERAVEIAESFNYQAERCQISQLDLCVDTAADIPSLMEGKAAGHFHRRGILVPRENSSSPIDNGWTSIRKKDSSYQVVLYDKRLEVQEGTAAHGFRGTFDYNSFWESLALSGDIPINRCEVRLFREGLNMRGIDHVDDLSKEKIEEVWKWFTKKYLCFKLGRNKLNPDWEALSQATCSPLVRWAG